MTEPASWEHMRAVVLHRDDYTCRLCGGRATEVDHIWPRFEGGPTVLRNLQAACGPCNKAKGHRVDIASATVEQLAWGRAHWQAIYDRERADLDAYDETLDTLRPFMENNPSVTVADAVARMAGEAA